MEKCTVRTKTEYEWDSPRNKLFYGVVKSVCDTSGKACKTAEEFKEKHTTKIEYVETVCNELSKTK
jgi:hypothetical protein